MSQLPITSQDIKHVLVQGNAFLRRQAQIVLMKLAWQPEQNPTRGLPASDWLWDAPFLGACRLNPKFDGGVEFFKGSLGRLPICRAPGKLRSHGNPAMVFLAVKNLPFVEVNHVRLPPGPDGDGQRSQAIVLPGMPLPFRDHSGSS